jgi:Polyphosphate kinase
MRQAQEKDILFSYPFESMAPFMEMMRQAAEDPAVLSIKITFYRIDFQSRLAELLMRAAENGKEVIVLMELRARFDEANNIEWSQRFDEAGCRVIFGLSEYKVHSKICPITKREFGNIRHITQVGAGNYNEKTARQYTDFSLITANREIGKDAAAFFNGLLLGKTDKNYARLWVAPDSFKQNVIRCINHEQEKALKGESGQIIIKCNSLTDKEIMAKLVEAAQSGAKISMIVRGICRLKPRVPGSTDNITVISIVGRFLWHSRVYCFGVNDGQRLCISSADLMTRNTERRVEIACPILDIDLKQRIYEMLKTMLLDNTKAWEQFADGRCILRHPPVDLAVNSQEFFLEQARAAAQTAPMKSSRAKKLTRLAAPKIFLA